MRNNKPPIESDIESISQILNKSWLYDGSGQSEIFIERTLQLIIPAIAVFFFLLDIGLLFISKNTNIVLIDMVIFNILLIPIYIYFRQKKLKKAVYFLLGRFILYLSVVGILCGFSNYIVLPLAFGIVSTASLLLPQSHRYPIASLLIIYLISAFTLQTIVEGKVIALEEFFIYIMVSAGFILISVKIFDMFSEEYSKRVKEIKALIHLLELRIKTRNEEVRVSRNFTEQLFHMSEAMNLTQSYTEILEVLAHELGETAYVICLNLFKNYDYESADSFHIVAIRLPGQKHVAASSMNYPHSPTLLPPDQLLIIKDISTLPTPSQNYYKELGIGALAAARIKLNKTTIGIITYAHPEAYNFSAHSLHLLRMVADMAAPAIDRIIRYEEQIKISNKLQEVDQIKSQFLASVSHELRTPLNAILNLTEFVALGYLGSLNEEQEETLKKSVNSSKHLLMLVNDILDITKIDAGKMRLFIDEIDLNKDIIEIKETALSLIGKKPIKFEMKIDEMIPPIQADRKRLTQILLNLLSNAIKFTEEGTIRFIIELKKEENIVQFIVSDTGPGIAPEHYDIIFEPFSQTDMGVRNIIGTGLGLPISRRLAEAHGGKISVEKTDDGATFIFTLPLVRDQQALQHHGEFIHV